MDLYRRSLLLAGVASLVTLPARAETRLAAPTRVALRTRFAKFTGDFDAMLQRRFIRMLVPYSQTLFFQDEGQVYGTAADGAQSVEGWINNTFKLGARPLTVALIPTSRDRLFDALLAGEGDIAAGDITITEDRRKRVAFTTPVLANVKEVVVTGADKPDLPNAEALSGTSIAVRKSTSYYDSLTQLNAQLASAGEPPAELILVPGTLESEDMMQMVAANLLPAAVVDDWIAGLWVQIIKGIKLQSNAVLRQGADIGWAVRPDNPKLLATLNQAIAAIGGNATKLSNRTKIYLSKIKQLHTATQGADMQRFQATVGIFKRYADEYGFDTLLLLSQSYQESRLNQNARSHVGAIGLMQLMPVTGNSLGVGDVHIADANVHAGAKYMARLLDVYFKDSHFDEQNRNLFAFAAYNAGPNKIRRLQQEAAAQKLDPNLWFDNVERVAAAKVGQEPIRYVRNIYKYYVAYKLIEDAEAAKRSAIPKPG
jgi:membrane-bound lytic murein transglycosylase MltF